MVVSLCQMAAVRARRRWSIRVVMECPLILMPASFGVLTAPCRGKGTTGIMARRKKHSPEEIVRKLQTAERLTAEGASGDEVARQLGISTATLYNWRNRYGAMDVNEAKELKRLRDENDKLKRLVADKELENLALKEIARGNW